MCNDESEEWNEKETKWEKGRGAAVNGGAALRINPERQRREPGEDKCSDCAGYFWYVHVH